MFKLVIAISVYFIHKYITSQSSFNIILLSFITLPLLPSLYPSGQSFSSGSVVTIGTANVNGGNGQLIYLDKFSAISTHPKPLQRVQPFGTSNAFGFQAYPAETTQAVIGTSTADTSPSDQGDLLIYLDRQSISCAITNGLLSSFQFYRTGNNQIKFTYKCVQYAQSLMCTNWQTDTYYWLADNTVTVAALANSNIACKSNEALQQLSWNSFGGYMRSRWTCCSFASTNPGPTMSPSTTCVYYTGWKWRPPLGSYISRVTTMNVGDYLLRYAV